MKGNALWSPDGGRSERLILRALGEAGRIERELMSAPTGSAESILRAHRKQLGRVAVEFAHRQTTRPSKVTLSWFKANGDLRLMTCADALRYFCEALQLSLWDEPLRDAQRSFDCPIGGAECSGSVGAGSRVRWMFTSDHLPGFAHPECADRSRGRRVAERMLKYVPMQHPGIAKLLPLEATNDSSSAFGKRAIAELELKLNDALSRRGYLDERRDTISPQRHVEEFAKLILETLGVPRANLPDLFRSGGWGVANFPVERPPPPASHKR